MHRALVDIAARAIVAGQLVATLAGTPIRAPHVDALLCAQARLLAALVHIGAHLVVGPRLAEAAMTVATVAAGRVAAVRIYRAHLTAIEGALVNVLAALVLEDVARTAGARVTARLVVARLVGRTACLMRGAFVDVCGVQRWTGCGGSSIILYCICLPLVAMMKRLSAQPQI